jgi:hypothetical protein
MKHIIVKSCKGCPNDERCVLKFEDCPLEDFGTCDTCDYNNNCTSRAFWDSNRDEDYCSRYSCTK